MKLSDATHRTPKKAKCLNCGKFVDAATQIVDDEDEAKPHAEAIVICMVCGHVMIYADDSGRLRELTDPERIEVAGDPRIVEFNTMRGPALKAHDVIVLNLDTVKRGALPIWTVYNRPKDYPEGFIARLHESKRGATEHTVKGTLDEIRTVFYYANLTRIARSPGDELQIVESWI